MSDTSMPTSESGLLRDLRLRLLHLHLIADSLLNELDQPIQNLFELRT
jgi:hypothetical protein